MKRFLIAVLCLVVGIASAQGPESFSLTPSVTSLAANSTNSTAGTVKKLADGENNVRIYLTATGGAATTNGTLVVKFITASGSGDTTNTFDTASLSEIKLTMSSLGANTYTISDRFVLSGAKYIKVGQIENTFAGAASNFVITVGYPLKDQ